MLRKLNYGREEQSVKERLTRNIGLKILSLLLAVLLWIVILNVDDPVVTRTFQNIPVTKVNENVLKSKDQVYEVISGDTVSVKVKGKRSIIESLITTDFQAIADLSQLSIVNAVPIEISVPKYLDEVDVLEQNHITMKVSLEKLETQQFRINVVEKGTVEEGYYVKEKTARPNILQVSAAHSIISKIKEVTVEVDVTNANESFSETAIPKVYDNNGTLMDSSKMNFNYDEVEVSVDLLQTKTVSLFIDLKGTPLFGYQYVDFEYEPKKVVIAGEREELDKVDYIKGEYNINNKSADIVDEVNIADFIKNDVILIDENQNAVINIDIEKLDSKELNFNTSEIEIRNLPNGRKLSFNNNLFNVTVYGKTDILASITNGSLTPYIDASKEQLGTKFVTIQFDPPPNDVTCSNPNISVTVRKTSG